MNGKTQSYRNENLIIKSKSVDRFKIANSADISRLKETTPNFSNLKKYDPVVLKHSQDENDNKMITANKPFGTNDSNLIARYKISNKNLKNSIENLKILSKNNVKNIQNQIPIQFGKHGRTLSNQFQQISKSPLNFNTFDKPFVSKVQSTGTSNFFSPKKEHGEKKFKSTGFSEQIEKNPSVNININLNMKLNHHISNLKDESNVLPNLNFKEFSKEKNKTNEIFHLLKSINHMKQNSNPQVILNTNHFFSNQNNINGNINNLAQEKGDRLDTNSNSNSSRKYAVSKEKNSIASNFKVKRFSPIKFNNQNEEQESNNKERNYNAANENKEEIYKKPATSNFKKVCSKSKAGVNFEGATKTNQDSFLVKQNIFNLVNFSIFGVFDGHGLHGHYVSNKIKLFFVDFFSRPETYGFKDKNNKNSPANNFMQNNHKASSIASFKGIENITEEIIYEKLKEKNYELLKNSFRLAEASLLHSNFEVNFSGSTSVVVINIGDKILCANAGDSRAILVTESENKETRVIALSRDHKPDLTDETNRILKSGGRVDRYTDDGVKSGPYRVWLRNETYPGLAMSRSIGDLVAGSVGVICEPEIIECRINKTSFKYIVLASDGVWEFISNEKIKEIIELNYKNDNGIPEKVIEESVRLWKKEDDVVDDITFVIAFFDRSSDGNSNL